MQQAEPALVQTDSIPEAEKSKSEVEKIQADLEIKLDDIEPLPVQEVIEETQREVEEKTSEDVVIPPPVTSEPEAMDETSQPENIEAEAEQAEKELEVSEIMNLLIFSKLIFCSRK